jgi:wyosine [tRNA(Phe)-imidazoG37] synthetase (radical SAM superfamily)
MATFLFDKVVFGPVVSRRLGISLGINLLPDDAKLCNFDCIYCECGWSNAPGQPKKKVFHTREEVSGALEAKLIEMGGDNKLPDVITFAGNGEPTMHPLFKEIIDDTIALRDKYCPKARIAVLTNATMLHSEKVLEALDKVDQNIQKLDSVFEETIKLIDQPQKPIKVEKLVSQLKDFNGKLIIQTMFIKGSYNGKVVDNTINKEVDAWLDTVKDINPEEVMIYTIARDTPIDTLEKVTPEVLDSIAKRVNDMGIKTQVSY